MNKREATREWGSSFDAIQTNMILELWKHNPDDWEEVTILEEDKDLDIYDTLLPM